MEVIIQKSLIFVCKRYNICYIDCKSNWEETMTASNNIAAVLKKNRQLRGWSQEDLARELGVSFATVNRWENCKTKPSRLAQEKIKQVANMEDR